jgi:hypothetical protein
MTRISQLPVTGNVRTNSLAAPKLFKPGQVQEIDPFPVRTHQHGCPGIKQALVVRVGNRLDRLDLQLRHVLYEHQAGHDDADADRGNDVDEHRQYEHRKHQHLVGAARRTG